MHTTPPDFHLVWKGPFKANKLFEKIQPETAGVYIWVTGKPNNYKLHYVGQSENLITRLRQHFVQILGGGYCLYDTEEFLKHELIPIYEPNKNGSKFFELFFPDCKNQQTLALKNIEAFTFYWVKIEGGLRRRESIESALINNVPIATLDNLRRSIVKKAETISFTSDFGSEQIKGIKFRTEYGPNS